MRTRGQVDGVLTYAETLYQTVPSTAEGVEAFRAASARGGSRRGGPAVRARPAVLRARARRLDDVCNVSNDDRGRRSAARRRRAAGRRRGGPAVPGRDLGPRGAGRPRRRWRADERRRGRVGSAASEPPDDRRKRKRRRAGPPRVTGRAENLTAGVGEPTASSTPDITVLGPGRSP